MDEVVIKVPAPFMGIEDLGFTARYPVQEINQRLRDVPFVIEGPARPMQRLVERLALLPHKDEVVDPMSEDEAYIWTYPLQLTDEVCVLAFRDLSGAVDDDDAISFQSHLRSYTWNLVRPLAFTFLRDCVRLAELRLAEDIEVVVETDAQGIVDLAIPRIAIVPTNGTRVLFAA